MIYYIVQRGSEVVGVPSMKASDKLLWTGTNKKEYETRLTEMTPKAKPSKEK